jgi:hypothetical protein
MATTLASLVSRLQNDVPASSSVPSSAQYEQAVKDAVEDFNSRAPLRKLATLSIVSGTANYDLPGDFRKVIALESADNLDGILQNTSGALIPVSTAWEERYSVGGGSITFYPTPTYTTSRDLWYAAGYVLDSSNIYQAMGDDVARIVMLKARAIASGYKAAKEAGNTIEYSIGDETVKKSAATAYEKQGKSAETEYLEAVKKFVGVVGMRGEPSRIFSNRSQYYRRHNPYSW